MDEIDIRLSLLLMRNSRIPYRDLADDLGISPTPYIEGMDNTLYYPQFADSIASVSF